MAEAKKVTPTAEDKSTSGITAPAPAATKPRVEPVVVTGSLPEGFTPPEPKRGGGATKYPTDSLAVGGAFGVKNKTKRDLAGIVNRANDKYRTTAKDADGKTRVISTEREFYAIDVDQATAESLKGTPFEGSTAMVIRSK